MAEGTAGRVPAGETMSRVRGDVHQGVVEALRGGNHYSLVRERAHMEEAVVDNPPPEGRAAFRLLVTGSRDWPDYLTVENALHDAYFSLCGDMSRRMTVVHGAARGADAMAAQVASGMAEAGFPVTVEPHPADWNRHGRAAGIRRNIEMIQLGAEACLAFIKDGSRGATHCADAAEKAGIPTKRITA